MENILIIHSDRENCHKIGSIVSQMGHSPFCAHNLKEGILKAHDEPFPVVFLEDHLPDGSGLDHIEKIKASRFFPEVVVVTSLGNPDEAERAIANGAWDYLEKDALLESLPVHIGQILEYRAERALKRPSALLHRKDIIGNSSRLDASLDLLAQAAQSDVNVLLCGETGTGKELFAKAIHQNSRRAAGNFVIVDCTALPETLVESVLFGHMRGSFTGAYVSQDGLVKQADKGTLFLDEIGELPLSMQKSFLRVIQERRFRPVGGSREIASEFRLVAATNRNLDEMAAQGQFREDLLFRLRTLVIELPTLRDRRDDLKELVLHYMGLLCQRFGIEPKGISPDFWNAVSQYRWPGNVRELVLALEKALLAAKDEPTVYSKHLPTNIRIQVARNGFSGKPETREKPEASPVAAVVAPLPLKEFHRAAVSSAENQYFKELMGYVAGNVDEACRISGLSRSRLYALLKKYRLSSYIE